MEHVYLELDDGTTMAGELPLSAEQVDSLLQFLAIMRPREYGEAVIDISTWTSRYKSMSKAEIVESMKGYIRKYHGGRVPGINRERTGTDSASTSGSTRSKAGKNHDAQFAGFLDQLFPEEGKH